MKRSAKTNLTGYDSNASRREFLRILGLTMTGVTATSLFGCQYKGCGSGGNANRQIRLYGTGTLDIGNWSQLQADLGIELVFEDNGNDPGPVLTRMIAGTASEDFDLGGLQGGAERELFEAGKIIPWDLERIPNWSSVWEWAKAVDYARIGNRQYGLPIVVNADSVIYLPEYTGPVDSYSAVFDERFKGRASMEDAWINSVIFTAIYLKESGQIASIKNPGDLELDELEGVMEFLISKKQAGQFLKFWQGWEDGLRLIKSKEAWVMTGWEPIVYAAQAAGIDARYAVPKEGYEGWSNDLVLHIGAEKKGLVDVAHQFANWELGGFYGCKLAELRGYVVPSDNTIEYARRHLESHFDLIKQTEISSNVKRKFLEMKGNIYWQNVRPRNFKQYEKWWSTLRNA